MFYGVPFLLVNIVLTLAFTFLILVPLSKAKFIHYVDTNNFIFKTFIGLPLAVVCMLTFGMTLISFLNVLNRAFSLGLF
ncbi:TPA_asm: hypothetical protein G0G16_23890 [Salmonella enterica subsp. enterica serovar Enteritidis]|uniref:Uncharacterized protein n=1 Tax=Salmonella enteritidis TaxID=149539 RepID=A0A704G252_SALEN|nr:hypothetical protein [Salmonella enterica subsp. enterica serovar Enteritidis]HAC8161989.1 hypothetical protein [Salmonella enterica subsp. enterica serovar Enteritidis]